MIIKNLTSNTQEIKLRAIVGDDREYSIYIKPNSMTDIDRVVILNKKALGGLVEIDGVVEEVVATEVVESQGQQDTGVSESIEIKETEVKEEQKETPVDDKFVCDICGAEFASARALSAHRNKTHSK